MDCELDMGYSGDLYTWRRRRLRERLDRAVCNASFHGLFPSVVVTNAPHVKSDHRPIVLDTKGTDAGTFQQGHGQRQFEARWLKEKEMVDRVTDAWLRTSNTEPLAVRTAEVHKDLHDWD